MGNLVRLIGALTLLCAGCHFGLTPASWQQRLERSEALADRNAAVDSGDFERAVAYDDLVITHHPKDLPLLRDQRKVHFAKMIDKLYAAVAGDEPVVRLSKLLALRREARREDLDAPRPTDLAEVDADVIVPALVALAPEIWSLVEAARARGEYAAAIDLGTALVDEVPPGGEYTARLADLRAEAANLHLGHAMTAAAQGLFGAQVLHAELAAIFGGDPGELAVAPPALLAQTDQDWTIVSGGGCADASSIGAQLAGDGYPSGAGQPLQLSLAFDDCPLTVQEWDTTEQVPYQIRKMVQIRVPITEMRCAPDTERVERVEHIDVIRTTTTVTKGSCSEVETGDFRTIEEEMLVDEVASITVSHRIHTMTATGSITLASAGGTRDVRFSINAPSFDDEAWGELPDGAVSEVARKTRGGGTEDSARASLYSQLRGEVWPLVSGYLEEQIAAHSARGRDAAAGGRAFEADDAFYIANQIMRASGAVRPELSDWIAGTYQVPAVVLIAALAGEPFPKTDLATGQAIELPSTFFSSDAAVQTFRSILTISVTGGVTGATPEGDAEAIKGAGAAFHVSVMGFGFRMNGGSDGDGNSLVDFGFYGGYGGWLGFLHVEPIVGVGMDATPGNDDYLSPSAGSFKLPLGAFAELGARAAYALQKFAKLEVMYTKAFRTSSGIPQQKRLDVRLILWSIALTGRYSEYLSDGDGLNPTFGPDGRAAKMWSILGGFGF